MRNLFSMLSFLCVVLVLLNELAGLLVSHLWPSNTTLLFLALIFGVWTVAETVMDAAEFVKGKEGD